MTKERINPASVFRSVDLGFSQVVDHRSHGRRPGTAEVRDDVGRRDFGHVAADAQHERRARRHRRFTAEEQVQRNEADHRDEDRHAEQREENSETASCHASEYRTSAAAAGRPDPNRSVILTVLARDEFLTTAEVAERQTR